MRATLCSRQQGGVSARCCLVKHGEPRRDSRSFHARGKERAYVKGVNGAVRVGSVGAIATASFSVPPFVSP